MTASALDRAARALADYIASTNVQNTATSAQTLPIDAHAAVRAVLAALDPPSPGMVQAGERAIFWADPSGSVERGWTAMLAAAREGA